MDNTLSSLYIYGQNYISHCCMCVCLWFCFLFLNIRLLDHFSAVERNIQAPCFSDYQRDERSLIYQLGAKLCLELWSSYSSPSVGRVAHTQELPGALSSPWHCARHWKIRWRECSQTLPVRSHFAPSLKQRKKNKGKSACQAESRQVRTCWQTSLHAEAWTNQRGAPEVQG